MSHSIFLSSIIQTARTLIFDQWAIGSNKNTSLCRLIYSSLTSQIASSLRVARPFIQFLSLCILIFILLIILCTKCRYFCSEHTDIKHTKSGLESCDRLLFLPEIGVKNDRMPTAFIGVCRISFSPIKQIKCPSF